MKKIKEDLQIQKKKIIKIKKSSFQRLIMLDQVKPSTEGMILETL